MGWLDCWRPVTMATGGNLGVPVALATTDAVSVLINLTASTPYLGLVFITSDWETVRKYIENIRIFRLGFNEHFGHPWKSMLEISRYNSVKMISYNLHTFTNNV